MKQRRSISSKEGSAQAQVAARQLQQLGDRSIQRAVAQERLVLDFPLKKLVPSSDNPRRISLDRAGVTPERVGELAIRPTEEVDQWIVRIDQFLDGLRDSDPNAHDTWTDLFDLALSINRDELLQPIIANSSSVIIAGERRWTGSLLAGKTTARVIVRDMPANTEAMFRLIENIQRSDLTLTELVAGLRKLLADVTGNPCGPDNKQIDIKLVRSLIGSGQTRAAYLRALCRLDENDDIIKSIMAGGYTSLHAAYNDASARLSELRKIANGTAPDPVLEQSDTASSQPVAKKAPSKPRAASVKTRLPGPRGGVVFLESIATLPGISNDMSERLQSVLSVWSESSETVRKNLLANALNELFTELDQVTEQAPENDEGGNK